MAKIHHSSIIDIRAELDEDVEVGPFCMVGPHVRIGAGTVLESHVVVKGLTSIGRNNRFSKVLLSVANRRTKSTRAKKLILKSATTMSFVKIARFRPAQFRIKVSRVWVAAIC